MTYKEKIIIALASVKTLDDCDYIEKKINETSQINRRTEAGRQLTLELLDLVNKKARELIKQGANPF